MAFAQSTLPAISPTALPAASPANPPAVTPNVAPRTGHPAEVSFAEGKLEVTADNSSLNQILREIGRLTGMTITGGVADERVFGKYGPAAPAEILGNLLVGSGSNMLLRETAPGTPEELVLTPRQGGPTPPNPNAADFEDEAPPQQPVRPLPDVQTPVAPPYASPFQRPGISPTGDPAQSSTPAGMGAAPSPPSTGSGNPTSPNGVQTPQQIYEQLQQLQRAQPKQ